MVRMKKKIYHIALKPFNNPIFYKNNIFNIDDGHNIFSGLKEKFAEKNVILNTIDIKKNADIYIYCDVPYFWQLHEWLEILTNRKKKILLVFESPVINPFNSWNFVVKYFNRVYTWDDHEVNRENIFKFYIPQINFDKYSKVPFKKKKLLAAVYSNKQDPPFFKYLTSYKNLYSVRNDLINYLDKEVPYDFNLYGVGWDKPKKFSLIEKIFGFKIPASYKGVVENKVETISQFKFCLAFENAQAPGYITEKIFDCFKAGCVPIYLGAPNVTDYIAKGCFVDYRDFKSFPELIKYLNSVKKEEYNGFIHEAELFLADKKNKTIWFEKGLEYLLEDCVKTNK